MRPRGGDAPRRAAVPPSAGPPAASTPMPTAHRARSVLARVGLLLAVAACGGPADDTEVEDTLAAIEGDQSAMTAPTSEPATPGDAPLTVDDIDRWQRGMAAELQAVREAGTQLGRATSTEDSATAIFAANEMSTREEGARGAGVDEERYRHISSMQSGVVRYMVPLSMEMNVEGLPAEMQKQMQESHDQALARESERLPADVLEALRPRAEALRRQEMELVGERLKAAGIGG